MRDLLRELAVEDHDIAISTLSDDNLNISIAMRTFDKGVSRTGLILKDRALVEAIQRIGLRPVSKRRVAIKSILKASTCMSQDYTSQFPESHLWYLCLPR